MVDGIDLHGSWAEDFANYTEEHQEELSVGSDITIQWEEVENEEMWKRLSECDAYTYVIAHYLLDFINDKELLIQRITSVLAEGGMFSCNGYGIGGEHLCWKTFLDDMQLKSDFIAEKITEQQNRQNEFKALLEKYFAAVEIIHLSNGMRYETGDELFERLCERYPENRKYLIENKDKIIRYFANVLSEKDEVVIATDSEFWHCYK